MNETASHESAQIAVPDQTAPVPRRRHLRSALGLFLLAPLVGEFLLGNLPITMLWLLLLLAPLYGGGALLIRETSRRFNLGWPGMVVLGLAYAVVEEAFVTQSLFNPNYVGLRLLDYGYIETLGISGWWTVFVLGIHTIWSTSVPIALVEVLTPEARRTPWLGAPGLAVAAALFLTSGGLLYVFQHQMDPFQASSAQLAVSAGVVVMLIALAFALGRVKPPVPVRGERPPSAGFAGGAAFVLGSAFMGAAALTPSSGTPGLDIPAAASIAVMILLLAAGCLMCWRWSRRGGWSLQHQLAVAGGLLLTYVWYGFVQRPSSGGVSATVDILGNVVFATAAVLLLIFAARSSRSSEL
jgi:hypothetical protein